MQATAVIVGAGINGLCVADALLLRQWRITVADCGTIPNPLSASYDRHRILRPHYPGEPGYCRLVPAALLAWEAIWDRIGVRHYHGIGTLALSTMVGDWTERARWIFDQLSMPYLRLTSAELARHYPFLNTADAAYGLMTEIGGILMADAILRDLAASVGARGATLVENFQAEVVDISAARVRAKDGRVLQGDVLIAAAGTGIGQLLGDLLPERFVPMRSTVHYVAAPSSWLPHLTTMPCWISLGGEDELWGVPPIAGIPMKLGCGLNTRIGDPMTDRHLDESETDRVLASYLTRFAKFDTTHAIDGIVNYWTMAPGGRFLFRQIESCYVLSACSGHGFKFAALTGHEVARAIATGSVAPAARRLAGLGD